MKNIFFCLVLVTMLFGCKSETKEVEFINTEYYIEEISRLEKETDELREEVEQCNKIIDSLSVSVRYEDYMNGRKIEKIKYYISITDKNPNNKQFFFGWIKRTMSDQ